jgi:hypothetical protein
MGKPKTNKSRQTKKQTIMSQMINRGGELVRINPKKNNQIDYSKNNGISWHSRYSGSGCGDFQDLIDNGKEILANTSKGLFYSNNNGVSCHKRG